MSDFNEIVMTSLTADQMKKLKKGKPVRLTPSQLQGGTGYLHLDMDQFKKFKSNKKKGKGMNIKMSEKQIGANPLLMTIAEVAFPLVAEKAIDTIMNTLNSDGKSKKKKSKKVEG